MFSSDADAVKASHRREEMFYSYNVKATTEQELAQFVMDVALLRGLNNPLGTEIVGELPNDAHRTLQKQGELYLRVDLITRLSNIPKDLKLNEVPIFKQVLKWREENKMVMVLPARVVVAYISNYLDLTLDEWIDSMSPRTIQLVMQGLLTKQFIDSDPKTHQTLIVSAFAEWLLNHPRVVAIPKISAIIREYSQASALTDALQEAMFKLSQGMLTFDTEEHVNILPEIINRFTETEERLARLERRKGLSEGFVMPGPIPDAGDYQ